jgi:hypothetical protein
MASKVLAAQRLESGDIVNTVDSHKTKHLIQQEEG